MKKSICVSLTLSLLLLAACAGKEAAPAPASEVPAAETTVSKKAAPPAAEPEQSAEPALIPQPEQEPEQEPVSKPVPEPQPVPEPAPEPEPIEEPEPEPIPIPEPAPAPAAEPEPEPIPQPMPEPEPAPAPSGGGLEKALACVDQDISALYAAVGEPESSRYEYSCSGPGDDGVLYYDGFVVFTYKENGVETVVDAEAE